MFISWWCKWALPATELSTCSAVCNTNRDVNRYIDFSESSAWSLNDLLFSTSFCLQFNCTFTQSETLRVAEWSVDVCFLFNFAYICFFCICDIVQFCVWLNFKSFMHYMIWWFQYIITWTKQIKHFIIWDVKKQF